MTEVSDPKTTTGALNKEYDGTACTISGYVLGNRTTDTHKPNNMIEGDFVNTTWVTNGVDAGTYKNLGEGDTQITLTATDAAGSPCYARDYDYETGNPTVTTEKLDGEIKIWPRTIDNTFEFHYNQPVYNGTEQIVVATNRGESDPTEAGVAWVYDKTLGVYLTTDDFEVTGTKYKNVALPDVGTYKASVTGKGNYRYAKDGCE